MTESPLHAFTAPRSVAVIGASRTPKTVGHVILHNLITGGFSGRIDAVNPHAREILGVSCAPDVAALAQTPDLAVVCTPPDAAADVIAALGARGTRAAIVITAGFAEFGDIGAARQHALLDAARRHGMRILGPNCVGLLAPPVGLNASFAHRSALPGRIALLSQSGAIVTTVLDWASGRGVGFSLLASMGAMADLDFADLLDHAGEDPGTDAVLLYMESVGRAPAFLAAARRVAAQKPVIVIKPGRSAEAARAAHSHTGALAGSDAVYDAAFRRAGALRVDTLDELFEAVETLAHPWTHRGDRVAILTNGGGVGVIAVDALEASGGALAALSPGTVEALDPVMPAAWSRANPLDIIGDAPGARYAAALAAVEADPGVDIVLALNCPTAIADGAEAARALLATPRTKPLVAAWLGDGAAAEARALFEAADVPTYETPTAAVRGIELRVRHEANRRALLRPAPGFSVDTARQAAARRLIAAAAAEGDAEALDETAGKALLALYGVPVVPTRRAQTPAEAAAIATELGFPVALKIVSPELSHKTDVGGVILNLRDAPAVEAAAQAMRDRIAAAAPHARLLGFAVQPMAQRPGAHELILGLATDPDFGPVVLFGHGGTAVEIIADKAVALPPLDRDGALDMIARTRIDRLLRGYRGRAAVHREAIVDVALALSAIALELPEIRELDINPLWADKDGVIALDARCRLAPPAATEHAARETAAAGA